MINRVRTLLRNAEPEPYAGLPGQELVDPAFRPVALPPPLARVRAVLFGRTPDRAALDLKLRRYLAVIHASPLAPDAARVDPRVTYPAPVPGLEFDFRPSMAGDAGHPYPLYLAGDPPGEDGGGALDFAWQLAVIGPNHARAEQLRPAGRVAEAEVAYAAGLGDPVALPGSGLTARFHAGLPDGTAWVVTCLARPGADLGTTLLALEHAGDAALTALFGPGTAEPYRTWKAVWAAAAPWPCRLAAALLALAERTDELRRAP